METVKKGLRALSGGAIFCVKGAGKALEVVGQVILIILFLAFLYLLLTPFVFWDLWKMGSVKR